VATRNLKSTLSVDFQLNRRPFALSSAKGYTQSENREFVDQRPEKSVRPDNPFPFGLVSTGPPCPKSDGILPDLVWRGPELSVLRMLGLFDRPADEKAVGVLLKPPAIPGLTESLINLSPAEGRTLFARLRRARLLAGEDPQNRGHLDTHPLVREYYGEQLRSQRTEAWKECNRRLYSHYRALAPQLPDNFREMEPLFLAVICGCNAGLFREALHEVYIPRDSTRKRLLCGQRPQIKRSIALGVSSFLCTRALGVTGSNGRRGAESHRGRSALHSHAGGVVSNFHPRIGST
jgi:hypothetical protein